MIPVLGSVIMGFCAAGLFWATVRMGSAGGLRAEKSKGRRPITSSF